MPDQPADPRHYEMKIPPDPPKERDKETDSEKSTAEERAPGPGGALDANLTHDEDNQQPGRQSGR